MADFKILRYLKKWRFLIFLVVLVGSVAVYYYGSNRQSYMASVVLEYTNDKASLGQNPDGSSIDTSEITSAAVITDVIEALGLDTSVESIRSHFTVTPVIPEEEEEKKDTAIKNGEEYEYYPVKYVISFESSGKQDADYVRDVLDALLSAYLVYYCENHVDDLALPNNAFNVSTENYDYIECMEILQNNANEMVGYTQTKSDASYSFYSASTGYSFNDLKKSYEFLRDNTLTDLQAYILENKLTVSQELLLEKKENQKATDEIAIKSLTMHISEAKDIIEQFGNKTLEGQSSHYISGTDDEDDSAMILGDVEDNYRTTEDGTRIYNTETTYDSLINQYADLQKSKIEYEIDLGKCEEILEVYKKTNKVNEDLESEEARWASSQIDEIAAQFNSLYEILLATLEEYNEQNGAQNLSMLSSIAVYESVNLQLYLMLAVVLFLVAGCMGAVVLGRIGDFVDYYLYVDHKTGLPNRQRCDIEIERYRGRVLADDFTCITLRVKLQYPDEPAFSREKGDKLLESFGQFLRILFKDVAFLGYNSGGVFLVFAENCTCERARSYIDNLNHMVQAHYQDKDLRVEYQVGYATTTTEDVYDIRRLMHVAFIEMEKKAAGKPEDGEASKENDGARKETSAGEVLSAERG